MRRVGAVSVGECSASAVRAGSSRYIRWQKKKKKKKLYTWYVAKAVVARTTRWLIEAQPPVTLQCQDFNVT
jgi:hypothetical protein